MNQHLQNILNAIQQGENLPPEEKSSIIKSLTDADKELQQNRKTVEVQNRELEIEAALERVRSRTMAMQKSDELAGTAFVLLQQFKELGESPDQATIGIMNEEERVFEYWVTLYGNQANRVFKFSIDEPNVTNKLYNAWKARQKSLVIDLSGQALYDFSTYRASMGGAAFNKDEKRRVINAAFFSHGLINVQSSVTRSEESILLLQRFAAVFEGTYTRFLDLQKAELQARESQIQLALERVRARTMAMQKSAELAETVSLLFKQLLGLGITQAQIRTCGIVTFHTDSPVGEQWITETNGEIILHPFSVPYDEAPAYKAIYAGWKNGETFTVIHLEGEALKQHLGYLAKYTNVPVRDVVQPQQANEIYNHVLYFSQGCLFIITKAPLPEYHDVFKRFGAVFQQSYTRFLDLQKAEIQARGARIETALEKVRSRTMGMQKSEELKEVIRIIYEQLILLNINLDHAGFVTEYKAKEPWHFWIADHLGSPAKVKADYFESEWGNSFNEAKEKGINFFATNLGFEDKNKFYRDLFSHTNQMPEDAQALIFSKPGLSASTVLMENVALYIENLSGIAYTEAEQAVVMRFGKVFEQTYTRFLDLQRAEAQAREAQIEASLERVRSKAISMRNSNDLLTTASIVFTELLNLGINQIRSGVGLIAKDFHNAKVYSASSSQNAIDLSLMGEITLNGHPVFEQQYQSWLNQENYFVALEGKELASYYKILSAGLNADLDITVKKNQKEYGHWFMFSEGFLYAWSDKEYTDVEIRILERFKNVMELTIRRYIELQKSEMQAREAVRQASLDRVRAEIASMRTTSDLERITPLIWNELTTLGVPFTRCGVFIVDEQAEQIHSYLSTPGGKAIAAFQLPFSTDGIGATVLMNWRNKQAVTAHWDDEEFKSFSANLVAQGAVENEQQYLATQVAGGLYLHFFPFVQGMLYAGNTQPFTDEQKELVQSLADAFSTAYARYEDFNKLEAAKEEVDSALNKLQATQKQLIQSEKMASLGELTAGIAHEIQNPLNFVNNFSEVNQEMIDELEEQLNNGDIEEAKAIAADIKQNEQKINHHGKRADAIVKGMLQHSRASSGQKEPTNINALVDEYQRLAYHGLRAKDKSFNATLITNFDEALPKIPVVPQDIGRVLINLFNNAFYAVTQKLKVEGEGYKPEVSVTTSSANGQTTIAIKDNGIGMTEAIKEKIMQPFFTTKPTGQGTGLGLSLSYDIIKAHGGEMRVETVEGAYTIFTITLPTT